MCTLISTKYEWKETVCSEEKNLLKNASTHSEKKLTPKKFRPKLSQDSFKTLNFWHKMKFTGEKLTWTSDKHCFYLISFQLNSPFK